MKLLTTRDLAELTQTSSQRIATWRRLGMPYYDMKTGFRYDRDEVMTWFKDRFGRNK